MIEIVVAMMITISTPWEQNKELILEYSEAPKFETVEECQEFVSSKGKDYFEQSVLEFMIDQPVLRLEFTRETQCVLKNQGQFLFPQQNNA